MIARPNDDRAETLVLDAIQDQSLPSNLRSGIMAAAAPSPMVGSKIVDYVVQQVTAPTDSSWRDTAIGASERIGLAALDRISGQLNTIAHDPRESPQSKEIARHALSTRAQSAQ